MNYVEKLIWTAEIANQNRELDVQFPEGQNRPYSNVKNLTSANVSTTDVIEGTSKSLGSQRR